jgi:hypothetical protein
MLSKALDAEQAASGQAALAGTDQEVSADKTEAKQEIKIEMEENGKVSDPDVFPMVFFLSAAF